MLNPIKHIIPIIRESINFPTMKPEKIEFASLLNSRRLSAFSFFKIA